MRLDVIVPTYNRCEFLRRAILSLLAASVPNGHQVRILVVDNRSTDATRETVTQLAAEAAPGKILYLCEARNQGKSFALNTGIENATAELIGFIDDDEEIDPSWYRLVFEQFRNPEVDYIGGRYRPRWAVPPPPWVNHPHTRTAIGWAEFGDVPRPFSDQGFDALLMGGNAILRRTCFDRVGLYCTNLGRTSKRLQVGEDTDMHERLIAAGLNGLYLPDLIIDHHIPSERVAKRYMRRWAFWSSASDGFRQRSIPIPQGPNLFGLPRHVYGKALRAPLRWVAAIIGSEGEANIFNEELSLWRFAGVFYGRNLMSPRNDGQREEQATHP